ncbi:cation:proton antiporter domain-containing protein [Laribacter hongkongensis]|uniref:cation:proton antiporter domain-containing protein n=1 Tax=Laribacter hongkongensis TaxID=168471 RepID=UPI001EFCC565|nr:cation:proton antiporter [Laribacter hongkongensis]MCG9082473.1 cation:proton antiporter [Laribacter hongkongensis]
MSTLLPHLSPLTAFGLLLLLGVVAGQLIFRTAHLPGVTGYLLGGFLIGPHALDLLGAPLIQSTQPIMQLALGLALFEVGRRIDLAWLWRERHILAASLASSALLGGVLGLYLTGLGWPAAQALLLASLGMGSAPAVLLSILRDTRAEGLLTERLLALTGLGNLAGFACFALALGWLQASQGASPATVFSQAALPLLAALLAGLVLGVLTLHLSKWLGYRQYVARQALLLGGLTLLTGLGGELALLPALAALVYGLTVRNLDRHYAVTEPAPLNWTPILLIALFIFTGAQFDWRLLPQAGLVAAGYIALRLLCQWLPLVLLARRSGLRGRRTLWLALAQTPMSSGAPGLLLLPWLGSLLLPAGSMALAITVLTLTELAGPSLTQLALRQAGEASD